MLEPAVPSSGSGCALAGLRVVDFSRILSGPYCTMVLGDLGADVVKIERPRVGDDTRHWGPPFIGNDAAYFLAVNRNKRSIALDLDDERDLKVARDLAAGADVVVENFRPGLMDEFGLGYELVRVANPSVIYCSISAFAEGPRHADPGYDIAIQALSGFMSITGLGPEQPAKIGVAMLDVVTGLYAAVGILAALQRRHETGAGTKLLIPLFDASVASLVNQAANHLIGELVPQAMGTAHPNIVPYRAFRAADGFLVIAAGNDRLHRRLCEVLGRDDLATDARFTTNQDRVAHRRELETEIEAAVAEEPVGYWVERLTDARVPVAPLQDLRQVFASPEGAATIQHIDDPTRGPFRLVASPIRFSEVDDPDPLPPPRLDEHGAMIRSELGHSGAG